MRYPDIDPQDMDPDTGQPYVGYSSPSLDTSFHDHEMAGEREDTEASLIDELAALNGFDPDWEAEDATEMLNALIAKARRIKSNR